MIANFDRLQVRVNVTWPSTILELTETSAVLRVPTALSTGLSTDRQTIVIIKNDNGESLYLPGRIVLSLQEGPGGTGQEHHIVVEFFRLSGAAKDSLQSWMGTGPWTHGSVTGLGQGVGAVSSIP